MKVPINWKFIQIKFPFSFTGYVNKGEDGSVGSKGRTERSCEAEDIHVMGEKGTEQTSKGGQ